MDLKQTLITAATGIALLTNPSFGGGPVIVTTEEPPIADVRPQGDGGSWVVPVIVGAIVLCASHCYEVQPTTEPRPWNGTGTDGWVVERAVVVRELSVS